MNNITAIRLFSLGFVCFAQSLVNGQETKPADAPSVESKPAEAQPAPNAVSKSALDMIPMELVNAAGEKVSKDTLKGKMVGLYFSAHWCPPCREFTPHLVAFRDAHTADFEVVFVSSDKTAEAMKGYMKDAKMLWPAITFGDEAGEAIETHFAIRGIPSLIILGADGQVITKNGRGDVTKLKDGAITTWKAGPAVEPAKP